MSDPDSGTNNLGLDDLSSEDASSLDVSDFAPKPQSKRRKTPRRAIRAASHDAGFHDRGEPTKAITREEGRAPRSDTKPKTKTVAAKAESTADVGSMRRSQFYRTGRSTQLNVKVRATARTRLKDFCDQHDWVAGQALEYALDALEEKVGDENDPFWNERLFHGVE